MEGFKNRVVGVISVTSTGRLILSLTNVGLTVKKTVYANVNDLKTDLAAVGWFANDLDSVVSNFEGFLPSEKVIGTVSVSTSNVPPAQTLGAPMLTKGYVIFTKSTNPIKVEIAADSDGWDNVAAIIGANCNALLGQQGGGRHS
jgi:hypothetical protein